MYYPVFRPRRLRAKSSFRQLVRETQLKVTDLIYPAFVCHGKGIREPIQSMPGIHHFSIDALQEELKLVQAAGIPGIIIFGLPKVKDERGSEAYAREGIVSQAVRAIKDKFPDLLVITDVCLCAYTSHGHCGVVANGKILNDATLELLAKIALSHVRAGADMVAPSDMMDGRVKAIRLLLDETGFDQVPILAYAAKYASAYYGPFREAAASTPQFGDRQSYQMDPANAIEALREVYLDLQEGADIVMVKPALAYLDIIRLVKDTFPYPVAAYNVSGEYAMVKAAAQKGWIDEPRLVIENLTAIKRAGADFILTYHALEAARWLSKA
jgi:porphobilinogen synthase